MARSKAAVVFRVSSPGRYDLWVDGRIAEYDVAEEDFVDALRRARVQGRVVDIEG